MKKNLLYTMLFAVAMFTLTSCGDDDSAGKSRFTYYAELELNDDAYMTVPVGTTFTDPGCVATMGGEDVSDQVVASGNVNASKLGFYNVNYVVTNPDGFSATASRTVAVVDKDNFASTYYGESEYGTRHFFYSPITIEDNGDGTYTINDVLGGFYSYGRYPGYDAYGYDFFADAVLSLNQDNTINIESVGSWYFGQYPISVAEGDGTYDPETGVIELNLDFDGDPFYVKLTK